MQAEKQRINKILQSMSSTITDENYFGHDTEQRKQKMIDKAMEDIEKVKSYEN